MIARLGLTGCSLQLLEIDEDEFQLDSVWVYEVEHRTDVQNIPNLRARDIMSVEPAGPPFQFPEGLDSQREFGTMVDPRNLLRTVEIAAREAGMEGIGAHTMRHSAAVAWLE